MKKLAIIGSTELAMQLAHFAPACGYKVVGYFDDFKEPGESDGITILGKIEDVKKLLDAKKFDEVIIGIGYKHLAFKAEVFETLKALNIPFATFIHPSCIVDKTAKIGQGTVLYPGCIIDQRVEIKENTLLNLGCIVSHDSVVGAHCFLSPAVNLAGFCVIGNMCNLGINTTVINNVSICERVQTGGSTLVIRSIEKPGLYVGVPAIRSK